MELLRQLLDLVALRETQLSGFFLWFPFVHHKVLLFCRDRTFKSDELYSAYSKCDTVWDATQNCSLFTTGRGGEKIFVMNVICLCVNCLGIIAVWLSRWWIITREIEDRRQHLLGKRPALWGGTHTHTRTHSGSLCLASKGSQAVPFHTTCEW